MDETFDISEILRIELNKAIERQIHKNPTTRVMNLDEVSTHDIEKYFTTLPTHIWQWLEVSDNQNRARWFRNLLDELYIFKINQGS